MADNVRAIFGGSTGLPEQDANCVAVLETLLEKAKAGEIVAVAIAAKHCDGLATANHGGKISGYAILGALEIVKASLIDYNRQS